MSWRILSVKGKRTSSQAGVTAWLPLPTVTVMVLLHHKTPQAAGINSGRGEAQWGWWLCWTCEQGLGVPTEWLGHLTCYSLMFFCRTLQEQIDFLEQKSRGIQPKVSWCWWSLYRENDVRGFCWRTADKAIVKKAWMHLFVLHLYGYIIQTCF